MKAGDNEGEDVEQDQQDVRDDCKNRLDVGGVRHVGNLLQGSSLVKFSSLLWDLTILNDCDEERVRSRYLYPVGPKDKKRDDSGIRLKCAST